MPTKPAFRIWAVLAAAIMFVPAISTCADEEELAIDEETPEVSVPAEAPAVAPAPVAATPAPEPAPAPAPATPAPVAQTTPPVADPAEALAEEGSETEESVTGEEAATEEEGTEEESAPEATVPEAPEPALGEAVPPVEQVPAPVPVAVPPQQETPPVPAPVVDEAEPPMEAGEDLTIDEAAAPAVEEEEGVAEELLPDEGFAAIPVFQWNPRDNKGTFSEFMNAGITGVEPGYFPSRVVSMALDSRIIAVNSEDIIISGNWRKGQVLAAYHSETGSLIYRFIGLVSVVASSGKGNTRATIVRSDDSINVNDNLLPVEQLQEDFFEQRNSAGRARLIQAGAEGKVLSVGARQTIFSGGEDYLLISRGKIHGVGLAWLCEVIVPGKTGGTTYGRVVRVDSETCFVKVMKLYQPVQTGDRVRLSISRLVEPGAKSTGKR